MKLAAALAVLTLVAGGCGQQRAEVVDLGGPGGPISDFDGGVGFASGPPPSFGATVTASRPPVPLSGGTLRVLADGKSAVAADPDRDQIYIVDLANNMLRATIALTARDEPGRAVEDAAGRVHVVARGGGVLVTIDPATATVSARRAVCAAPRGVAYEAAGDRLHVACAGGELVTLPAAGGTATRTIQLERDLRDVLVVGGQLWVSTFRGANIITVASDGTVGGRAVLPEATDLGKGQPLAPGVAWRMSARPDGTVGVVHQLALVGPVQTTQGGYGGSGGCSGIVQGALTLLDATLHPTQIRLASTVLPADVAFASTSGAVAVLSAGNAHTPILGQVLVTTTSVVGPGGGVPDLGAGGFDGGTGGGGGCLGGTRPAVSGEAIAVAFDGSDQLWVQTREPASLQRLGTSGATVNIKLSSDSRADTGWAVFHSNSGAGIACASCHPEGGEDARTWEFAGIGPRRTQTLRGHVGGTEPFHWNGELANFDALFGEVYLKRMSGPPLGADQKQALFGWINTIPTLPQSAPADPAAVARGKAMFEDTTHAGCVTCHSGPQLSNNATVDVGTGAMFQVPRLAGVAWRAPFLHDGCAPSLTDRFGSCGGGDKHGVTSTLTAAEIADLVSYLDTL